MPETTFVDTEDADTINDFEDVAGEAPEQSPRIPAPEEVEEEIVRVEARHVFLFLGGLTVSGLLIFCGWEYVQHRLKRRRANELTGNMAEIIGAGAEVAREVRLMSAPEFEEPEYVEIIEEDPDAEHHLERAQESLDRAQGRTLSNPTPEN